MKNWSTHTCKPFITYHAYSFREGADRGRDIKMSLKKDGTSR